MMSVHTLGGCYPATSIFGAGVEPVLSIYCLRLKGSDTAGVNLKVVSEGISVELTHPGPKHGMIKASGTMTIGPDTRYGMIAN